MTTNNKDFRVKHGLIVEANTHINGNLQIDGTINDLNINSQFTQSQASFDQANTAINNAASASQYANTGVTLAQAAFNQGNSTATYANTGINDAASASSYANTGINNANSASSYANAALTYSQTGFAHANAAFNASNTKFSSSGGTISGNTIIGSGSANVSIIPGSSSTQSYASWDSVYSAGDPGGVTWTGSVLKIDSSYWNNISAFNTLKSVPSGTVLTVLPGGWFDMTYTTTGTWTNVSGTIWTVTGTGDLVSINPIGPVDRISFTSLSPSQLLVDGTNLNSYTQAAFNAANTSASTGKAIAMSIVFGG